MPLQSRLRRIVPQAMYQNPSGMGQDNGTSQDDPYSVGSPTFPNQGVGQNYDNTDEVSAEEDTNLTKKQKLLALIDSKDPAEIDTPLMRKYQDFLLNDQPKQEDFKQPGRLKRIQAGLATLSTDDPRMKEVARDNILHGDYNRAMRQYDSRATQLGEGAGLEERLVSNKRMAAASGALNEARSRTADIAQQKANDAAEKARRDEEIKVAALQANVDKTNAQLEQARANAAMKDANTDAALKSRDAERAAIDARHALDITMRENALAETKRQHDAENADHERQRANDEARIKALQDAAAARETPVTQEKIEKKPPNLFQRIAPSIFGEPEGKTTTTTTTKGKPGATIGGEPPPIDKRVAGVTTWLMPNGKTGTWNGTGWEVK